MFTKKATKTIPAQPQTTSIPTQDVRIKHHINGTLNCLLVELPKGSEHPTWKNTTVLETKVALTTEQKIPLEVFVGNGWEKEINPFGQKDPMLVATKQYGLDPTRTVILWKKKAATDS